MEKSIKRLTEEKEWRCPDCGCVHAVPACLDEAQTVGELLAYTEATERAQVDDDDSIPF